MTINPFHYTNDLFNPTGSLHTNLLVTTGYNVLNSISSVYLFMILSLILMGCDSILDSESESHVSLGGQLSKLERYYFINEQLYQFDTTRLGGYTLQLDSITVSTDSCGHFKLNNLSTGRYTLQFKHPQFKSWDTTLSLTQSQTISVLVHPKDSGYYSFKGTLHYIPHRSYPNPILISSLRKSANNVPIYFGTNWVLTDSTGSFHYKGIKQGHYRFGVYSNFFLFKDTTIQLNQNIQYHPMLKTSRTTAPLANP